MENMEIEIQNINRKHFYEIINLSDHVFGEGYIKEELLELYIKSEIKFGYVAIYNSKFSGFILNQITLENLNKNLNFELSEQDKIGVIKSIAIKDQFQKKGIARKLIEKSLKAFGETIKKIICIAWDNPDNHLINLLNKFNFTYCQTIPEYWKNESLISKFKCKKCGKPPCSCTAQIWVKKNI
jgi:ribosomal protein S18 acetylase RimI-like enzyme